MSASQNYAPTMKDLMVKVGDTDQIVVGGKVSGKIIFLAKNQALIEIPNVGLGIVRGKELYNEDFLSRLRIGEEVESIVIELDNELGFLELSFREIGKDRIWKEITKSFEEKTVVEGKIRDANRGGFLVKVKGIDAFLPASLLAPTHAIKNASVEDNSLLNQMKKYIGQNFQVKIININQETETLIVSEKAMSDEIAKVKLQKYKVNDVIEGHIVGVVDFGLFVRFDDDLEGLVHISEIAWKKVENPHKEYKVGQKVTAKIVDIGSDYRINLSIKQMMDSPWKSFAQTAKIGDKFLGTVSKIVTYGAIVVSSLDIQGLCHISQITEKHLENPAQIHEVLKVGETKEFTILSIDSEEKLYLTLLPIEKAKAIQEEITAKKEQVEKQNSEESEK